MGGGRLEEILQDFKCSSLATRIAKLIVWDGASSSEQLSFVPSLVELDTAIGYLNFFRGNAKALLELGILLKFDPRVIN